VSLKPSARGLVDPFIAMEVMRQANERAAAGEGVLHLEIGQPGTKAPAAARKAAAAALESQQLGYTDALGLPSLRQRIARHYQDMYGLRLDPGRVVITSGSSAGFVLAFLALFETGDAVALGAPGYPAYRNIIRALGLRPLEVETGPASRYQPTAAQIGAAAAAARLKPKGLLVASPANPSGTMLGRPELAALADYCQAQSMVLISDEIYHGITYGQDPVCALSVSDDAIIINSFSKYFSMTGWRVGWMIVPADLAQTIERLQQSLSISVPTLSQIAAEAAFDGRDELEANVACYARNRAVLLDGLPPRAFPARAPADGAFYVYATLGDHLPDSEEFCARLLAATGVALTPGVDFDQTRGQRTVRISFAGSLADVTQALARIRSFVGE